MSNEANDDYVFFDELLESSHKFEKFFENGKIKPEVFDFLKQIALDITKDDIKNIGINNICKIAYDFWLFSEKRDLASTSIRLINNVKGVDGKKINYDVLEIICPNSPFIVDSIMGEISAQNIDVQAMFHPLIEASRDKNGKRSNDGLVIKESMIEVYLPHLSPSKKENLLKGIDEALKDVRLAVHDYHNMKANLKESIKDLSVAVTPASNDEIGEYIAFLKWIENNHFVFLGYRFYEYKRDENGNLLKEEPKIIEKLNLGILRDMQKRVLRKSSEPTELIDKIISNAELEQPLTVAKSNLRSKVHRRAVMDYFAIKNYDENGKLIGEERFLGLFTAEAYDSVVFNVPLLRRKVENIIKKSGFDENSHNYKRLRNILENYPRDELFQSSEEDLLRISLGVQHLLDRPRTAIFARQDIFDRFISVLVYVPRDRYNTAIRVKIGNKLAAAYGGRLSANYPVFGDAPLARINFIIGVEPFNHMKPNISQLEQEIAEITKSWEDDLENIAPEQFSNISPFIGNFPAGYKEKFSAKEAIIDINQIIALNGDGLRVRVYRNQEDNDSILRCKLYKNDDSVALSEVMPIFESLGLYVESEAQYRLTSMSEDYLSFHWVHDVEMRSNDHSSINLELVKSAFEEAFVAIWSGLSENDSFNKLIIKLGINWRKTSLLRAFAKWRGQTGLDPSQKVQEQTLNDYPQIADNLVKLFEAKFDPEHTDSAAVEQLKQEILSELEKVPSLDADRVIRRILGMIDEMVRTNYYQKDENGNYKPYMSFKIATSKIEEVPNPKPFREIWVYSPIVEGAHLRFGPVARGGLRWSDRRDDFRTEVLGLVKAQQVKNAVIVPVGSKGAFFPKKLPINGSRDEVQKEGIKAYTIFLSGLLDITDNIDANNDIIPPKDVVCHEGDDPYLVVAADKGTATFSDIANSISQKYGFWLGDAFASGGSQGYDHKKMGITAKGAWEAVKRHFREIGHDTQSQEFDVIGIGDMSGDVFGNGMLLSRKIRLVAAFDHRDIFIDPNPDCEKSFEERQRLFELPRSSWQDYNQGLISEGGGIFSRSLKSITLTPQMKELTGIESSVATPFEIMNALLKTKCDLLWFGGIGTYIKASSESNADAGDKANDNIRINGKELNAKVIGEGANLGVTQLGRIEAAKNGVRLNSDAIDNSAGVDSSDHEVNIKILLNAVVRSGSMTYDERNVLLASMTDDVAQHVLAHNYNQTLAISLQQQTANNDLIEQERFMERLEALGHLNRKVEFLPSADEMRAKIEKEDGLTRPELGVLTAYAKIQLFNQIVESDAPDDEHFEETLVNYFPEGCHKFEDAMKGHRLKREIIATVLANHIVDIGGVTFMDRVKEAALVDTGAIVRAYSAAMEIFELRRIINEINGLDLIIPANLQYQAILEIISVLRRQTYWLSRKSLRLGADNCSVNKLISLYCDGVNVLKPQIDELVSPFEKSRIISRKNEFVGMGASDELARKISNLRVLISSTDIVDISNEIDFDVLKTARIYHLIGDFFGFDEMRYGAGHINSNDHWDRIATRRIIEDLMAEQAILTKSVINYAKQNNYKDNANKAFERWCQINILEIERTVHAIDEIKLSGGWTFAKLTIANTQLKEFSSLVRNN